MDTATAREIVYGMPYAEYKARYQEKASAEKVAAYEASQKRFGHD
jgi:hypothetical protein